MLQSFRYADFEALAQLWAAYFPARYRIDAELLKRNTVESPVFDWGASLIHMPDGKPLGFVVVKRSARGCLYPGGDDETAHLCAIAYTEPQIAVDMLAEVKSILHNRGLSFLRFGQDAWHFFPGCPTDCAVLRNLLMVEGFVEGEEMVDLERDLTDYRPLHLLPPGSDARPLLVQDLDALYGFLDREFPGRWRYDVEQKVLREGRSDCVFGLFVNGALEGFALLQRWDDRAPMAGAVWRMDLGDHWGSLGPIGVSRRLRGKGYGDALLGAALAHLRDLGVRRCLIDWTNLTEFYGRHGFEVTRRYREMVLNLDSLPVRSVRRDFGLR